MTADRRRLANRNAVRGFPDWTYGVRISRDGRCWFSLSHRCGGQIERVEASVYRTTTLARFDG